MKLKDKRPRLLRNYLIYPLKPIIEKISNEKADKIDCYYHDIESQPNEPTKHSVRGVPTILLFKSGKLLGTKVGASSEKDMLEFITPHI